ncbi:Alpha-amylase [Wickerhamomyces ciferrii]|uniref:Alpha-amylase n=1 Tax=Wickerhamomyces ciferrii (strain ATCC 14091 / BCRC 22168 / CBS 111 / JCM 3599 / NBRC 0793 / NRRL Y-1031 F-60-10) TaxID=1206466 RepID=K0KXP9_WICCF|nr:Alpha-amylase [Wickerhamomyces ciferrii]CCH46812.1 Alpha-amylase [Wickerhamomyces ciferrii]
METELNENLSNEILEMDTGSLNIEEAFLAEQQEQQQQKQQQRQGHSIPKVTNSTTTTTTTSQLSRSSTSKSTTPTSTTTTTTKFNNTTFQDIQNDNNQTKAFRFVNNSPNSMHKQKSRMKPTFKVGSQLIQGNGDHLGNNESVIIEQTFNHNEDGSQFINSNDRKYVFQLNVKRPPGRPRKYPLEKPKAKRPQGRPRKYPIEVTGSTINHQHHQQHQHQQHNNNNNPPSKIIKKTLKDSNNTNLSIPVPIDTELISLKKEDDKLRNIGSHSHSHSDLENNPDFAQNETNFAIATAGATQSAFTHDQRKQ